MTSPARVTDLAAKGWRYLLAALAEPKQIAYLPLLRVKGIHVGEFLKMNREWIRRSNIRTIIDIGAHEGEFGSAMRAILPGAQIYAFEPLPECCSRLRGKFKASRTFRAFEVALGENSGKTEFWRSRSSKSSSVLPMASLHRTTFPWTAEAARTIVEMRTLDSFLGDMRLSARTLMKIDVQGYEDRVLRGGMQTLQQIDYLLIEVSFQPLYHGQASFRDISDLLTSRGFSYAGNMEQLCSPRDGAILQADAFFLRNGQEA